MNERIKELVKQAEQYALDKANEGNDEDYDYSFDDDFQEKFAELIVRECAAQFPGTFTDEQYQRRIDKTILKHFGVIE